MFSIGDAARNGAAFDGFSADCGGGGAARFGAGGGAMINGGAMTNGGAMINIGSAMIDINGAVAKSGCLTPPPVVVCRKGAETLMVAPRHNFHPCAERLMPR